MLARSPACLQAFRLDDHPAWGVQFHPEVTLADLRSWFDHRESDPAAVASGLDPKAISAESAGKIGAWNASRPPALGGLLRACRGRAAPPTGSPSVELGGSTPTKAIAA